LILSASGLTLFARGAASGMVTVRWAEGKDVLDFSM